MDDVSSTASGSAPALSGRTGGDVRMPADSLRRLSRLSGELGAGSVAALREAGRAAGRSLMRELPGRDPSDELGVERFWEQLGRAARGRGYGRAEYRVVAADVARVDLHASPEASPVPGGGDGEPRPGCHFAAGWLGGALTAAAGEPVAVLEVECGAGDEDPACGFLVGPEGRLEEIRASMAAGASVEEALEDR